MDTKRAFFSKPFSPQTFALYSVRYAETNLAREL